MGKSADVDTSSFQNVVLMLIGVLMVMLISNILTIISNPDNVDIGTMVISGAVYSEDEQSKFEAPKFQNKAQDPVYIDVHGQTFDIYKKTPSTVHEGSNVVHKITVSARDLALPGNEFEKILESIEQYNRAADPAKTKYFVLLLRPDSVKLQRKLRTIIRERGIDMGFEPFEQGLPINMPDLVSDGENSEPLQESPSSAEETPSGEVNRGVRMKGECHV